MLDANAIRLKACRRRGALDQAELAQLMGTSYDTISRYECGRGRPDVFTLLTYELLFDIPASKLLPDTTHTLRRTVLERSERLLKRLARPSHRQCQAKVDFVRSLCQRLRSPSP